MNPLSDWSVDAEAVAEHQQRLLNSVGYRERPFDDDTGTTSPLRAPPRCACWLNRLRKLVPTVAAPQRRVS
jgi:hypothetical protein